MLPERIERVSGLVSQRPVGHGNSDPEYALDGKGRLWVMKKEKNSAPAQMVAESIGWQLGRAIGVRCPDAGVCLEGDRAWLSLLIESAKQWKPTYADSITNYDELGAMLVLDTIIINEDRHAGNLLVEPHPDQARLRSWAIDSGDAKAGYPGEYAVVSQRGSVPVDFPVGLPIDAMIQGIDNASQKACELTDRALRNFVDETAEIGQMDSEGANSLLTTLADRCARAKELSDQVLDHLRGTA